MKREPLSSKIKAGVLGYVVGLSLVITMLILLMFSIHRYTYREVNMLQHNVQLSDDLQAAALLLEKGVYPIRYDEAQPIQLRYSSTTIEYTMQKWGLFDIVQFSGKRSGLADSLSLLTGDILPYKDSICLYMADHNNYLSISGDTHLVGTCYLPEYGVSKAYVEGINYSRDTLIFGSIAVSEKNIPSLKSGLLNRHKTYFDYNVPLSYNTTPDSLFVHPISEEKHVFYYANNTRLTSNYLGGKVTIICDSTLTLPSSTYLDGCIVVAQSIMVEKNFIGRFQGFAQQAIDVEDSSKFLFPSVLFTNGDDNAMVRIGNECFFCGVLIVNGSDHKTTHLKVGEDTVIEGIVYNNGTTEIKGCVWGELYTERFLVKSQFNRYDDFLLNVEINKPKLSKNFVGINLFDDSPFKFVMQCYTN